MCDSAAMLHFLVVRKLNALLLVFLIKRKRLSVCNDIDLYSPMIKSNTVECIYVTSSTMAVYQPSSHNDSLYSCKMII